MKKRGVGVGCMWYGIGNTGLPNPAGAYVDVLDDGSVVVMSGCADIGQGSNTTLSQIAAEELGVYLEDVKIVSADTGVTPDAGATSASRQTYISGNAVRLAAREAKKNILQEASLLLNCPADKLDIKKRQVYCLEDPQKCIPLTDVIASCRKKGILTLGSGWFNPDTTALDPKTGQGKPYGAYAFATHVAEVEVDTETGVVKVLKIVAAHDVGQAINPLNAEGQIEGGVVIGMGYGLLEEIVLDKGEVKSSSFATYLIPTALDTPEITPILVEDPEPTGPFGAKGLGEPALIPTAAAIANAVYNAVGVRITELPITPERLLEEMKKQKQM